MDSLLQELARLVPPPAEPKHAKGDWKSLEQDMGLVLPGDYEEYIELYGSGTMCAYFAIDSPFSLASHYKVTTREGWLKWTGIYHCWGEEPESEVPFPLYPKVPGLLPWGIYGDVDVLGWLTDTDPTCWHIVYMDREKGFFDLPGVGFLAFLLAAIKGEAPLPESVLGKHVLSVPHVFKPY